MGEWQKIETAPKDGTLVLLWGRYWSDEQGWMSTAINGRWRHERWEVYCNSFPFGIRPTHWMPLPPPPPSPAAGETP